MDCNSVHRRRHTTCVFESIFQFLCKALTKNGHPKNRPHIIINNINNNNCYFKSSVTSHAKIKFATSYIVKDYLTQGAKLHMNKNLSHTYHLTS